MIKFIVLYFAPSSAMEKMKESSPEDKKKGMEQWMVWAKKCGDGLVDLGLPLGNGHKVTKDGSSESDNNVVGYSILQADDIGKAQVMLLDHPHLSWTDGCEIEVYECFPLPG